MKYEIWINDKAGIPTFIKEYPYKIQCWTWALMNGYIYKGRHWYFKDERLEIRESEGWMLTFNLKKQWFDKIKSGEKTHEYRLATDYWRKRIEKWVCTVKTQRLCPYIELRCGHPKSTDKDKILKAVVIEQPKIINGKNTDLAIDKPVYDIEFEIIKEQTNEK